MRSFEHGYLLETAISHPLLISMRVLGEYRGRQNLYTEQFPEVMATLRQWVGTYRRLMRLSYHETIW